MPKKLMWVQWEDDAELSQSRKSPGDYSPLTRDPDRNLGHVVLSDADEDDYRSDEAPQPEPDPESDVVGALILLAVVVAAVKAAPHVRRWWNRSAVPFVRRARKRIPRRRRGTTEVIVTEPFALVAPAPTESSPDVFDALRDYRASMGSAEARDRFVASLVARLFADEQLRILRNARIQDDGSGLELVRAVESLTPEQLDDSLRLMLEANPSWPDDDTLAELERMLAPDSEKEQESVLVRSNWINKTRRAPGDR